MGGLQGGRVGVREREKETDREREKKMYILYVHKE